MYKFIAQTFGAMYLLTDFIRQCVVKPVAWIVVAILAITWLCSGSAPKIFKKSGPPPKVIVFQPDPKARQVIRPDILEQAVGRFHLKHHRLPKNWEELEKDNIIQNMPSPPAGKRYVLGPSKMDVKLVDQ
jgi:hypothetical protein